MHKYLLLAVCAAFAGCAGLNAQRRDEKAAARKLEQAEKSVSAAKQGGAASCAAKELKMAEANIKLAKGDLNKKEYVRALTLAKSADLNAAEALKKCEAAKRKKTEVKSKTK